MSLDFWHPQVDEGIYDPQTSLLSSLPTSDSLTFVGTNDKPQASPTLSSSPLTGADPPLPVIWQTLNSFIPIFELLGPKFVLDGNAYYIHGVVDNDDLAVLRDHNSMVTEFILTDGDHIKPNIAPSAFFHIAQFLGPDSCLLPSLSRLCIDDADTYFPYLHLLHAPSLKTLEATNVPDHQHPSFFSFLTTLMHKVPLLENIILGGPGRFPLKSLEAVLKFTYLHQLELRDVVSTINFTFLQDVGGSLPNLQCFILDARSCEYVARIPEEPFRPLPPPPEHMAEVRTPRPSSIIDIYEPFENVDSARSSRSYEATPPSPPADILNNGLFTSFHPSGPVLTIHPHEEIDHPFQPISVQTLDDTSTSTMGGFHQLKKFHVVGGLSLIQDMIAYIASNTLEDISITFIRPSHLDLNQKAEEEEEEIMKSEAEAEEMRRRARNAKKNKRREYDQWGRIQEFEYQEIEDKTRRVQKRVQEIFDLQTASYITLLQTVSSRWSADLKVVKFNQLGRSYQPLPIPPALPKQVYETLFRHPKLEILDCERWKLDSVKDFLLSLKSSGSKNLKQLHLPIDGSPNPAVSLIDLLDIAKAFPMLESLQCCIDTLSPIPQYSIPTTNALSHGLQTLFIANDPTSRWDFKQLLLVARHLYLMFPHIQTIDNVEGLNAEQWVRIRDLVDMFQTTHKDDLYR